MCNLRLKIGGKIQNPLPTMCDLGPDHRGDDPPAQLASVCHVRPRPPDGRGQGRLSRGHTLRPAVLLTGHTLDFGAIFFKSSVH